MPRIAVSSVLLCLCAAVAHADQGQGGVYVDSEGVVKRRSTDTARRLRELRSAARKEKLPSQLTYISLPRLFAEVKRKIAAGEKIPDEMRTLRGMVKLQYVFVYPDEKDLVIAGPAEPIDFTFPGRPVGKRTGRPALQLDDLVVALRTCGPGRVKNAFGCSIDLTDEALQRMNEKYKEWKEVIKKNPKRRRKAYDEIARAGGPQPVRFFNITADTRFAFVCLEADYLLKLHSLGLIKSPVKQAASLLKLVKKRGAMTDQAWFEADYKPLRVSADGLAFEIRGQSLQIKSRNPGSERKPVSARYATQFTRHFTKMSEEVVAWADLANLADLAVLAALIGSDRLHEKAGWDLAWILKDYPVAKVPVARSVPTLINFREASTFLVVLKGGVKLAPADVVQAREKNPDADPAALAERPDQGWGLTVRPPR